MLGLRAARLADDGLEKAARDLINLATLRHIQEEMDNGRYQERVANAFNRLWQNGRSLFERLDYRTPRKGKERGQLDEIELISKRLSRAVPAGCLKAFPEQAASFEEMRVKLHSIRNLISSYRDMSRDKLDAFCGESNRNYVRKVTLDIAKKAERHGVFSILVLGASAAATYFADRAVTQSGSLLLQENRTTLLLAVFPAMFALSWSAGAWFRNWRIGSLNDAMRTKLHSIFALQRRPKDWADENGPLLPMIELRRFAMGPEQALKVDPIFTVSGLVDMYRIWRAKFAVFALNCVAIWVLTLLLSQGRLGWPGAAEPLPEAFLVGQSKDGRSCLVERGDILRVTDNQFVVQRRGNASDGGSHASQGVRIDRSTVLKLDWMQNPVGGIPALPSRCDSMDEVPKAPQSVTHNWSILENFGHRQSHVEGVGGSELAAALASLEGALAEIGSPIIFLSPSGLVNSDQNTLVVSAPNIFIDGKPIQINAARNTLLLPLFQSPVVGLGDISPAAAYEHGRRSLDAESNDGKGSKSQIAELAKALSTCAASGTNIDLDVIGFASKMWLEPRSHSRPELNHQLAEGRRVALLSRLWEDMGADAARRVRVWQSNEDDPVPISDMLNDDGAIGARFASYEDMEQELANWVGAVGDRNVSGKLREYLARSAVVRIVGVAGGSCVMPTETEEATELETAQAASGE